MAFNFDGISLPFYHYNLHFLQTVHLADKYINVNDVIKEYRYPGVVIAQLCAHVSFCCL